MAKNVQIYPPRPIISTSGVCGDLIVQPLAPVAIKTPNHDGKFKKNLQHFSQKQQNQFFSFFFIFFNDTAFNKVSPCPHLVISCHSSFFLARRDLKRFKEKWQELVRNGKIWWDLKRNDEKWRSGVWGTFYTDFVQGSY